MTPAQEADWICATCGAHVLSTEDSCPACLLQTGLNLLTCGEAGNAEYDTLHANAPHQSYRDNFGDYELIEEIGRGGQAVVYRARQKTLNRTVALKIIPLGHWTTEAHVKRFRLEAEAAARLEHPGIVPIYEIGERERLCYFTMRFVDGGDLHQATKDGPLAMRTAALLMAKLARTVHYAHEHGVLHRDIKPSNVLLDSDGESHLTDFGLARLVETDSTVTRTRDVMGTPSYIAPEQAGGRPDNVTRATDVYGLGAVFYELLTGHPPFAGGTTYETVRMVLETEPRKPRLWNAKVDRELETICLKCLEKDPQRRYPTSFALAEDVQRWLCHEPVKARRSGVALRARKWVQRNPTTAVLATLLLVSTVVLAALWWGRSSQNVPATGIAVLPFENLSADKSSAYFAEAIQDEILTRLSKLSGLKVISRTSTERYNTKPQNLSEIGKQLAVAHVLEGSVQKTGDAVRVNVQLMKAANNSHLWANTFDAKATNIFSAESDLAKAIADQVQVQLTGKEEEALSARPTDVAEAYDAYLRGVAFSLKANDASANVLNAQKYLRQAVQLDPKFALAWARLSRVDAKDYFYHRTPEIREEARRAAETAIALQPNLGEALHAQGYYHYACVKDFDAAMRYFERAHEVLPNNSEILESMAYLARRRGDFDRSESYFKEAERLDPRDANLLAGHAGLYELLGRYAEAVRKLDEILDIVPEEAEYSAEKGLIAEAHGDFSRAAAIFATLDPASDDFYALEMLAYHAVVERRPTEIIPRLKEILARPDAGLDYHTDELRFMLGWAQQLAGDQGGAVQSWHQARQHLQPLLEREPENSFVIDDLALIDAALGDKSAALALAERAVALNSPEKDRVAGCKALGALAWVAARVGDVDGAVSALQKLRSLSADLGGGLGFNVPLTSTILRLDSTFDPLRGDPRFEQLVQDWDQSARSNGNASQP